jgi:hypothetical protein
MSTDRLPPIPPEDWTPAQRLEAEAIIRGPRGALVSPFIPLLRSPELMAHDQRMGEYLRYRSADERRAHTGTAEPRTRAALALMRRWPAALKQRPATLAADGHHPSPRTACA